jgi:transposase-like protein
MNVHKNARLTPVGRALMADRIEQGWPVKAAAQAAGVSTVTAYKWRRRHRLGGERRHHDRSSAPRRCPRRTPEPRVAEIERLRRQRMSGPAIAQALGMAVSTVGAVLRRLGLGKLANLDPKPAVIRYERSAPGEMIHLDIKKLGRFDIEGHRITGDRRKGSSRGAGWDFLHVCGDDASRLAYTEILPSERKEDTTAFLERALAWLARHGVSVERVMTDNGSAYRSKLFAQALQTAGAQPCPNPALYAKNQWQGRALHPDQLARMGLRQALRLIAGTNPGHQTLDRQLQSQPPAHRHQRPHTLAACEQPSW